MHCKNCGSKIPDDAAFCHECGAKRPDNETCADGRSSANIRNLPSYAREIDRSDHAVDSDRKRFGLFDSGRDKSGQSGRSRKDDGGDIVRISSSREKAAPAKEPAASEKKPDGFVNPLKESGGTVFRSSDTSGTEDSASGMDSTAAKPSKDATAAGRAAFIQPEKSATHEPDEVPEANGDPGGFVNPLKGAGLDIHLGSDGDLNQPADDSGEFNSPHLKFAVWMVILSCTCCNPVTLILGIIAVVFAFQVAANSRSGQTGIAIQKAQLVRVLCWITFGLLAGWVLIFVLFLCLPMPEDHTQKDVIKENQTEQVEDENGEKPAEQDGESVEKPAEQADGENIESAEPDVHHSPLNLLLDILD